LENDYESNKIFNVAGIQKISTKKLKQLTGDNTMSEELADVIIDSLYKLSIIAYETNINE
tara:strand:+ start:21851 stop:22030 length:180 start_codon:yes stop_codon:yes gene_type:complete